MSRTTTRVAQAFFSSSRRFNNQGVKSAGVLPPVSPHKCREEVRIGTNKEGITYKITWRH
jgi:hypothetical protein